MKILNIMLYTRQKNTYVSATPTGPDFIVPTSPTLKVLLPFFGQVLLKSDPFPV